MTTEHTLIKYFPELDSNTLNKLISLENLYTEWNSKINVISRKDIGNFTIHHLLHSLGIAKITGFRPGTSIIDVGTGGGFPGIPLAIFFPGVSFTLIDSIRKKTIVALSVAESLELKNVKVIWSRAEEINQRFDFVVSRAVTAFPQFVSLTGHLIAEKSNNRLPNGILYLKGGELRQELGNYYKRSKIFNLKDYFKEEFFLEKKVVLLPVGKDKKVYNG